jgi:hypothetical protein
MSEKNGMQVLEIHYVTQDDVGVYTCMVANGSGKASMSAELSIPGMRRGLVQGPLPGMGMGTLLEISCSLYICVYTYTYVSILPQGQGL